MHPTRSRKLDFLLFMAAAIGLRYVPGLGEGLKFYETFFHEVSHGLASVIFGGVAGSLTIRMDGSGQVLVGGGSGILTSFAGYAGAVGWGCLIYAAASAFSAGAARYLAVLLGGLALFVELRWVSFADPVTLTIVAGIGASMLLLANHHAARLARPVLRLIGANVAVTAMATPTYILHEGIGHNDAADLMHATLLPEWVWVAAWLAWGVTWMVLTWRAECKADRQAAARSNLPADPLARLR